MIRHIVMWKFRPGTEAEQQRFLDGLRALQGVIPQLLKSEVAVNVAEGNYDAVLVSEFESLEALDTYKNDPPPQGRFRPVQVHPGGSGGRGLRILRNRRLPQHLRGRRRFFEMRIPT